MINKSLAEKEYEGALRQIVRTCKSPYKYNKDGDSKNVVKIAEAVLERHKERHEQDQGLV